MKPECRARKGIEKRELSADEKAAGHVGALRGQIPYNSDSGELRDRGLNSGRPFIERMAPDCFKRSLAEDADQMGFAGHTDDPLCAFARAGVNLTFTESRDGLAWEALVPDTAAGRDLMRLVDTKIIRGASFEFNVEAAGETWEKRDGKDTRTITAARLYTVNPVAWPAYDDSELTVSMRGLRGGRDRRGYYAYQDEDYLWADGNMTPDTAYALCSLGREVTELSEALDYLRDNPAGAHTAYATAEAAEAAKTITTLTEWLAANGAKVPEALADRAKATTTEARKLSPSTDASRERRRRALSLAPVSPLVA